MTCKDCNEAARHAYSDATTPGFFSPKCEKHREHAASDPKPPSAREFYEQVWSRQREERQPSKQDLGTWEAAFDFAEAFAQAIKLRLNGLAKVNHAASEEIRDLRAQLLRIRADQALQGKEK